MEFKRRLLSLLTISLVFGTVNFATVVALTNGGSFLARMGEETIGNEPFTDANFKDWPNLMPVINNKSRVYHTWVNGDERFYFESNAEKLNELLVDFAKLKGKKEVLIVPQTKDVSTFDGSQSFAFNCQLHLVGGIVKLVAGKDKGHIFWPIDPQLTIHVTPRMDLAELKIPEGVALVSLSEIKARYKSGLDSTDKTVRGWGIGFLVRADQYDDETLKVVSELAVDADDWVALNALSSLKQFGPKVKDHLARLKAVSESKIKRNAERAKEVISDTEAACKADAVLEFEKKEKVFREQAEKAQAFIDRVRGV